MKTFDEAIEMVFRKTDRNDPSTIETARLHYGDLLGRYSSILGEITSSEKAQRMLEMYVDMGYRESPEQAIGSAFFVGLMVGMEMNAQELPALEVSRDL